jgi:hypothetical protein
LIWTCYSEEQVSYLSRDNKHEVGYTIVEFEEETGLRFNRLEGGGE